MRHLNLTPGKTAGNRLIRVPKALADRELMVCGRDYTVRFGLRHTTARLGIAGGRGPEASSLLALSSDLLDELLLAPGEKCRLRVDQANGLIVFGPLVGVLVSPLFIEAIAQEAVPTSAELHGRAARAEHVAVFYFCADEIDWEGKAAVGWVPADGGRWTRRLVPLPDIVYDRANYGRDQDRAKVAFARDWFSREPGIRLINARQYLDKWWLHKRLIKHALVRGYLPDTVRYKGLTDLGVFLGRYPHVFVKSFYGSGGTEVISIKAAGSGTYLCHTPRDKVLLEGLDQVGSLIECCLTTDKLIVQEGIDIVQYEGSSVDMRALVQKDGTGDWCAPQIQLRVAEGDRPMANLNLCGRAAPYDDLMPLILGGRGAARARYSEACDLSLLLARHIEHEYGPFGEIGLDLALDKHDRLWFLEANARPDKDPEVFEEGVNQVYPQFQQIFAYARFLTRFTGPSWWIE